MLHNTINHWFPLIWFCLAVVNVANTDYNEYCIIGAGPGGLQMGYFLHRSKRNYVIFEKDTAPGSFFKHYPRHRRLLSVNKRYTGQTNAEFNLRHDWNSLISDDPALLFTKYSTEYFPHADTYVKYLKDYQEQLNIRVQFNATIGNIEKVNDSSDNNNVQFRMVDQNGHVYKCRFVIAATGLPIPRRSVTEGDDRIEHYETVSIDPNDFANQVVLVIGWGNSGMETAKNIYGHAAYVHLAGKLPTRLSWETHYVGDIRGVNNEVFDSYMLKSLDGFLELPEDALLDYVNDKNQILRDSNDDRIHHAPSLYNYDRIILCIGFKWDDSIFNKSSIRLSEFKRKYPQLDRTYQATTVPGLYFAGGLAHSLDWHKSAGGFIHGYRYIARALHRHLEWKNHHIPWPSETMSIFYLVSKLQNRMNEGSGIYQMFTTYSDVVIIDRNASIFTYLEEVPTLFIPELPQLTGHEVAPGRIILTLSLQYGINFSNPGKDIFTENLGVFNPTKAHESKFIHPVLRIFHKLPKDAKINNPEDWETMFHPYGIHHVVEDFTSRFSCPSIHGDSLRMFLEHHLGYDLRPQLSRTCSQMVLFTQHKDDLPIGCHRLLTSALWDI